MATWIAHLRIAENLLSYGFHLDIEPFLVGSIAPDSGIDDGAGGWIPDKDTTHWRDVNYFQPENFYDAYVAERELDTQHLAFYMGYYAHLVADIEWIANIWQPLKHDSDIALKLEADPDFVWEIKKDWYGHDFVYLKEHPDNIFTRIFHTIEQVPDYLDYFPNGAFTMAVERIKAYYADTEKHEQSLNHNYPYLSRFDMDGWILGTSETLIELFKSRDIPCPNPRPLLGSYSLPDA